jgi:hypothetical protein
MKYTNKLSVFLMSTQREYLDGSVERCLRKYFESNASPQYKIDLQITFNKGKLSEYSGLDFLTKFKNLNNVYISTLNLSGLDDFYAPTPQAMRESNLSSTPKLGGSTGPNNLFYKSFDRFCDLDYRDYLLIEVDSQPVTDNWIDKLVDYCDNKQFLIAGSTYKGKQTLPIYEEWTGHLNGIALYRNSPFLKAFIQESKKLIEFNVNHKINNFISFDVAMHKLYSGLFGRQHCHDPFKSENHLINCPVISNFSLPIDSDTTIESVKEQYPQTIILHKKWN